MPTTPRPTGGAREFVTRGGATVLAEGRPALAGRLQTHLRAARERMPAAAAFMVKGAVACLPPRGAIESSKALRLAVALGAASVAVCAMTPDGAMAQPLPAASAPVQVAKADPAPMSSTTQIATFEAMPVADVASVARTRARTIMASFTPMSQTMAEELHPDLLEVAALARRESGLEFEIVPGTGGHRTLAMQRQLVAHGASKTMTSRHLSGLALDFVPMHRFGNLSAPNFFDKTTYMKVDGAMRRAAAELGVPLTSGLDFKGFPDLGHYELEKTHYAAYEPGQPSVSYLLHAQEPAPLAAVHAPAPAASDDQAMGSLFPVDHGPDDLGLRHGLEEHPDHVAMP